MAPLLAAPGREGAVEESQTQTGPRLLAVIEGRQRIAILHVGRHDSERQDMSLGIDQRDALAPDQLLGPIVAARPAHTDALDALGVDDRQPRLGAASAAPSLTAGESAHQRLEQAFVGPAPEPAIDRAPGWKASRQSSPGTTRPQMPGDPRQHPRRGRRIRMVRWIRSLEKAGHLVQARLKHHVLQTRLVTRPMSVRPHLLSTPPRQADFVFAHETDGDDRRRTSNRL